MTNPYLYIVLNGELEMSAGKSAAQTAHAVAALHRFHGLAKFSDQPQRTVIVLEAKNQHQIDNLETYLMELGIPTASYIDEGHNEVDPYSVTALAVGPIEATDIEKRDIFKGLPLYGKEEEKVPLFIKFYIGFFIGLILLAIGSTILEIVR